MKVISSIKEMQETAIQLRKQGKTIGYVPTMGFLHEGHLTLVEEAKKANDIVVMSIFVNPLQFGPNEDFDQYPRDFERDEKLANEKGVDYLFYPTKEDMYPKPLSFSLSVLDRVDVLCGKSRQGHFDGVATVVMKLFHIVSPDKAYFGLKDAQQVAVVQAMVNDFNIPITIVAVPTVREEDGLAKSSRNVRLTERERVQAPVIYQSLKLAEHLVANGERNSVHIKEQIVDKIKEETNASIDYVEVYTYPELKEALTISDQQIIIAVAVRFSSVRLIDNILIHVS